MKRILQVMTFTILSISLGTHAHADFTKNFSSVVTISPARTEARSLFCTDQLLSSGGQLRRIRGELMSGTATWQPIPGSSTIKANIIGVRFLERGQIGNSTYRATIENRADDPTDSNTGETTRYLSIQLLLKIDCFYKDTGTTLRGMDAIDEALDRAMEEEDFNDDESRDETDQQSR